MTNKQVLIARKLTLTSADSAREYNIERQFNAVKDGLTNLLNMRGTDDLNRLPKNQIAEINHALNMAHLQSIVHYIQAIDVIKDVLGLHSIPINKCEFYVKDFNMATETLKIDLICISGQVTLIETIGDLLVLKGENLKDSEEKLITLKLSETLTLHSWFNS